MIKLKLYKIYNNHNNNSKMNINNPHLLNN